MILSNKRELPFEYKPILQIYQYRGFLLGMLQGYGEITTPWLCCNMIFCEYGDVDRCNDIWCSYSNIIIREKHKLNYSNLDNFVLSIKEQISLGYFVNGMCDEYYIEVKRAYLDNHVQHDFLVTGYDDDEGCFISAGYVKDEHFDRFKIPYLSLYNSITSLPECKNRTYIMKVNSEHKFEFDKADFFESIYKYIKQPFFKDNCDWYNVNVGIDTWLTLIDQIYAEGESNVCLSTKDGRFLLETRAFMKFRLLYLRDAHLFINKTYVERYDSVVKIAEAIHLLIIKYNLKHRIDDLKRIRDLCYKGYCCEYSILSEFTYGLMDGAFLNIKNKYGRLMEDKDAEKNCLGS